MKSDLYYWHNPSLALAIKRVLETRRGKGPILKNELALETDLTFGRADGVADAFAKYRDQAERALDDGNVATTQFKLACEEIADGHYRCSLNMLLDEIEDED